MPTLTPEAWAQIRADYEHGEIPIHEICLAHGISATTLRDRMRRWRWTRRRPPVPREGPPAIPPLPFPAGGERPAANSGTEPEDNPFRLDANSGAIEPPPHPDPLPASGERETGGNAIAPVDPAAEAPRLQGALARVLPAIEASLTRLASSPQRPREMEQTARALGVLMRTLRELNGLIGQQPAEFPEKNETHQDIDALREKLAQRLNALLDAQQARRLEEMPKRIEAAWLALGDKAAES